MKIILVSIIVVCSTLISKAQPGKYTGTKKGLIKTVYTDSRNIRPPAGWSNIESSVLNSIMTRKYFTVNVFKKSTTYIILFRFKKNEEEQKFTIADVLEIAPVFMPAKCHCKSSDRGLGKTKPSRIFAEYKKSLVVQPE